MNDTKKLWLIIFTLYFLLTFALSIVEEWDSRVMYGSFTLCAGCFIWLCKTFADDKKKERGN